MRRDIDPIEETWYNHLDKGQPFYVVAVNKDEETVEIQHYDGDVEELSFREWRNMNIEVIDEPENWAGAVDIGEVDDYGTEVTDTGADEWREP